MTETKTCEYKVIGTRPVRHDGVDKVVGRAQYGADIHLTGMLHGRVLRSPHAHALIKSIDTSKAEAYPGVKAVVTARDMPVLADKIADLGESVMNLRDLGTNILAAGKTLYHGHAVAAVAAVSAHIAEEALALIKVEYEILPPVMTVEEAMKPDAPLLHPTLTTRSLGKPTEAASNIASHSQTKKGDVEAGFAAADVIVDREFRTEAVHQGYIEPQNATAQWNQDGTLNIWTSTQGAFSVQAQIAEVLELPVSKIRVTPMEIGGGFGGKIEVYLEPLAALLSRRSGRPVKLTMSRAEVLMATGPTSGSTIRVKIGATRDGKITAAYAWMAYEAGAYPGSPVGSGAACIFTPYRIPNVLIDAFDVVVNRPKAAAYRAPGATNAAFASEMVIDEICQNLQMDPLDLRYNNGVKEGDARADGPAFPRIGYLETVEAARRHPHYSAPLSNGEDAANRAPGFERFSAKRLYGRGVASGFWMNYGGQSTAYASVNADGTIHLVEGSTDIGGTRTSSAMQCAEVLGLPSESINPTVADTASIGYTEVTGGSRTTFATGWACYEAAQDVKKQMIGRAARLFEVEADEVELRSGAFVCTVDPAKTLTFAEVAAKLGETGGPVVGRAAVQPRGAGVAFATHIVDIELDAETGAVEILRYTAVQDVGKAIHPSYVEGQIQGGVAQGVGWALNEEYCYDDWGHLLNASFLDYRIPTCLDLPMIEAVIIEAANPGHPFGVRGVGEVPIVPPPAAIGAAISRAIGCRVSRLPMSPRRILETTGVI